MPCKRRRSFKVSALTGPILRRLVFVGLQEQLPGMPLLDLWNPTEDIADIVAGSTVTGNSLRRLGLHVPSFAGLKRGYVYKP